MDREDIVLNKKKGRIDLNLKYSEITKKIISSCVNTSRKNNDKKMNYLLNHSKMTFNKYLYSINKKDIEEKSQQLLVILFSDLINMYYILYTKENNYNYFLKFFLKNSYNYLYGLKKTLFNLNKKQEEKQLEKIFKDKDVKYIQETLNKYIERKKYEETRKANSDK